MHVFDKRAHVAGGSDVRGRDPAPPDSCTSRPAGSEYAGTTSELANATFNKIGNIRIKLYAIPERSSRFLLFPHVIKEVKKLL